VKTVDSVGQGGKKDAALRGEEALVIGLLKGFKQTEVPLISLI